MTMKMIKKLFFSGMLLFVALMCYGQQRKNQIFRYNGLYFMYVDNDCSSLRVIPAPKDSTQYAGDIEVPSYVEVVDTLVEGYELTEQRLEFSVQYIDAKAFQNTAIKSVSLSPLLMGIGSDAFKGCSNLSKAFFEDWATLLTITYANEYANPLYVAKHLYVSNDEMEVTEVTVPDIGTTINPYTFAGGEGITSVNIPNVINRIETKAFLGCKKLKRAIFASVNALCQTSFADKEANPLYYAHHLYLNGSEAEVYTIEIPSGVTNISKAAFAGANEIMKVVIPASVTSIGEDAFMNFGKHLTVDYPSNDALTYIEYGNSYSNPISIAEIFSVNGQEVTSVEFNSDVHPYALAGAKWLEQVRLSSDVSTIGESAFNGCTKLEDVIISADLLAIGQDAFKGCSKLSNISLPATLQSIGKGAFRDCSSLESIIIPSSVTSLGAESFLRCYKLKKADIQAQVNTIPNSMFQECGVLYDVTLSDKVERIEGSAFISCHSLTGLPKGGKLAQILDYAFSGCKGLVELHLPTTIEVVGQHAFANCPNLTDLIIPQEVSGLIIRSNAFASTNNLKHIYSYTTVAPSAQPNSFGENTNIELFYPEGATGYDQVPWCNLQGANLTSKTITYYVDKEVYYQDVIQVGRAITPYAEPTRSGWEFSGWIEPIPSLMPNEDLEIHGFFMTRQNINTLTYTLRSDNKEAKVVANKEAYQNLTDVTVPDSVAFEENKYFVATIDSIAFRGSRLLQRIVMSDSLLNIGHAAFAECPQIYNITLPKKITVLADSLFYKCTSLVSVEMTDKVKIIKASAFSNCTSLNMTTLPSKLESLGNLAFTRCDGLDHVVLPKSIKTMGTQVFLQCTGLKSVSFEEGIGLTRLPSNTFQKCTKLTEITLAPTMKTIDENAFSGCTALTQLILDEGIEAIGANAFSSCSALQNITLPQSIVALGSTAFGWSNSIRQITVNKPTPPTASANAFTDEVYANASLFVPDVAAYSAKSPWTKFKNIGRNDPYHLKYVVDGKECADTLMVVGSVIISRPDSVSAEGRAFSGWNGEPSVMPGKDVTVTGAFKYHRLYQDVDTKETIYEDSLFYNESIATHMPNLDKDGCRYEIQNEVNNMPANDTIINVRYYPTEANNTYGGLTYHIYTEGDDPHAELIPGNPAYAGDIVVPDTITYMGEDNRYPVTAIRTDAFKNCINMTSVTLPETITLIGSQAFANCVKLTEITIPKSVETIGTELFLRCGTLKTVTFEDGEDSRLETLSAYTFSSCSVLDKIDLPSSLTTIANQAFIGCSSLKEITIPLNVASIGEYAFLGCKKLEKITIASETTLPHASDNTFEDDTYDKATLYVSETVQAHMESPWINFENVELGGSTTAEKCATPKIYYNKGTLRFECDTPEAVIKSEITVSDAIKMDDANSQKLNKTYIIKASATAIGYKRSDVKEATIIWQDGKLADMEGFDGDVIHEEVEQQGVAGDMNGDGQVTAEDAALILKKLVGKEDNNNQGE